MFSMFSASIFLQPTLSRITFEAFINDQIGRPFFLFRKKKRKKEINKEEKNEFDEFVKKKISF